MKSFDIGVVAILDALGFKGIWVARILTQF